MAMISDIAPSLLRVALPLTIGGLALLTIIPLLAIALGIWNLGDVPPWRTDHPRTHRILRQYIVAMPVIAGIFLLTNPTSEQRKLTMLGPTVLIILLTFIPFDTTRQVVGTCARNAR